MKKIIMHVATSLVVLTGIILLFISCEPISVSVSQKGEVAFTRDEGVFYIDLKSGDIQDVYWNYGKKAVPIIVRWSPDNSLLAYTIKADKDAQETEVYVVDKKGKKSKKIYSVSQIITQLEWSPNGSHISIAQAGDDSDMSVADIAIISEGKDEPDVVLRNTGDVHDWISDDELIFMKIHEKNENNSDMFKGDLSSYNVKTEETTPITPVIVAKTGYINVSPNSKLIAFTAVKVSDKPIEFTEDLTTESGLYLHDVKKGTNESIIDRSVVFAAFSPDGKKILVKSKERDSYSSDIDIGYIDLKYKVLKPVIPETFDTISVNSATIQVYPAWIDDSTIIYWHVANVYGSNGQSFQLYTTDILSLKRKFHQLLIDSSIYKLIEKKGGK